MGGEGSDLQTDFVQGGDARHVWRMVRLRGVCGCHVAPPANPSRFTCLYSFLNQFLGQILEALCYSKWVIQDTVGKLEKSTFQRYKVCANRSSDGKVMAPGSRVV